MSIKKLLGKRIQEIRKSRKITQEQLAELVSMDTSSISNIENGKYYPSSENLDKILEILNVRPHELFAFESFNRPEKLIEEMYASMKQDITLARLMYKFYLAVKF